MRKRFEVQYELGCTQIEDIKIPEKSRDELPPVLRALQHIYVIPSLNKAVFDILESKIVISPIRSSGFESLGDISVGSCSLNLGYQL